MINGSLNSKAMNSKVKNLQQIISKRKKVMDSTDQNTVTGGHIVISFALKTNINVDLSITYVLFFRCGK